MFRQAGHRRGDRHLRRLSTISCEFPDGTAITVQTPTSPLFAALLNQGVSGGWTLELTNTSGTTVTLNDWSLNMPLTTNVFAVPNPVNGVPFQFPYNNQTLPLIVPGPHVVSTAVVSTGTYNTVSNYNQWTLAGGNNVNSTL